MMMNASPRFPLADTRTSGPVVCAACGCRLQPAGPSDAAAWFHFGGLGGRDARGCRVECADAAHDSTGQPVDSASLG
ncbi:MAG TPA: hypothetical protein VEY67_05410 [Candidatus Dormibacteraeota bacterium]|nr:hypothetical protein [Candidatus Dormibacteraeota bacterium]